MVLLRAVSDRPYKKNILLLTKDMLDNLPSMMVKYFKLNTAVNGKSNQFRPSESLGRWLEAWIDAL